MAFHRQKAEEWRTFLAVVPIDRTADEQRSAAPGLRSEADHVRLADHHRAAECHSCPPTVLRLLVYLPSVQVCFTDVECNT